MRFFFVTRWGNPHHQDGPDGPDTNFIVRAADLHATAHLIDTFLQSSTVSHVPPNRAVQSSCNQIIDLGSDDSGKQNSEIIHGPWIAYAYTNALGYKKFRRDHPEEDWQCDDNAEDTEQDAAANP